jgi:flagellar basal body-associated protein FliL
VESPPETTVEAMIETPPNETDGKTTETPRAKNKKEPLTPAMKADPISRKLILLSLIFATLALSCIGYLTFIYQQKKHANHATNSGETSTVAPQAITQGLEEIMVVLKNEQELRVEMVAECSQIETCDYLKDHIPQARDLLIPVLSGMNPQDLPNVESKNLLRKKLTDRLNTLEMPGKVIQIEFVNLSVEGNPK